MLPEHPSIKGLYQHGTLWGKTAPASIPAQLQHPCPHPPHHVQPEGPPSSTFAAPPLAPSPAVLLLHPFPSLWIPSHACLLTFIRSAVINQAGNPGGFSQGRVVRAPPKTKRLTKECSSSSCPSEMGGDEGITVVNAKLGWGGLPSAEGLGQSLKHHVPREQGDAAPDSSVNQPKPRTAQGKGAGGAVLSPPGFHQKLQNRTLG